MPAADSVLEDLGITEDEVTEEPEIIPPPPVPTSVDYTYDVGKLLQNDKLLKEMMAKATSAQKAQQERDKVRMQVIREKALLAAREKTVSEANTFLKQLK